jgi:hypothetical protein
MTLLQDLDVGPGTRDGFLWADFAELRAIAHPDTCFSRGDLDGVSKRSTREEKVDVEDRWRLLSDFVDMRKAAFGEAYPFVLSGDRDTLELEFNDEPLRRVYIGLLIAACMRNIILTRRNDVARVFELVSLDIFANLMPVGSEIHPTWAAGGPGARYRGTLFEKMKHVARDLRCTANFVERDFKASDTGDGGIDIIAWHPMSDSREGIPISFAQCGCARDEWRFKMLDASPAKHHTKLPTMHPWATYYFLPIDLRESDGGWAYQSDIAQAIIVDRLRIVQLSQQYDLYNRFVPTMSFVDDALATQYA